MLGTLSRPLEVLRISTVVDFMAVQYLDKPLEVLRISTVVDHLRIYILDILWKY